MEQHTHTHTHHAGEERCFLTLLSIIQEFDRQNRVVFILNRVLSRVSHVMCLAYSGSFFFKSCLYVDLIVLVAWECSDGGKGDNKEIIVKMC